MSIAEKLTTIANNQQAVYDAGYSKGESDFWDTIQRHGERTYYEYGFRFWDCEYIRPKYKVIPENSRSMYMFGNNKSLIRIESKYFDLSQVNAEQSASTTGHYNTFSGCSNLEVIEDIGLPAGAYYSTFHGCPSLKTIEKLRVVEDTIANNTAFSCSALENITIDGTIGTSFNFQYCTKLTHESLMSIIDALQTKTEGTWTVTLGTTNLAKLTDAEKAIATEKGWTLA